jgi:methylphosphotriester-DNA--protein-cysteine methyltransferase
MPGYPSDDAKFNAIITADQNASFVFSYKNSNIYCRSTCQAHPPLLSLADISFYPSSDAAKTAGLKPCVVCNPDLPVHVDSTIVQQTVNAVNSSIHSSQQQQHQQQPSSQQHLSVPLQQNFPVIHHIPQHSPMQQPQNSMQQNSSPLSMTYDFNSQFYNQQNSPIISPDSPIPVNFPQQTQNQHQSQQPPPSSQQQQQQHLQQQQQLFLCHNRSSSTATSPDFLPSEASGWRPRRASIANGHIAAAAAAVEEISKTSAALQQQQQQQPQQPQLSHAQVFSGPAVNNPRREERHRGEGDHARLVNEACMYIAAAAAAAAQQAVNSSKEEEIKNIQYASPSQNASVDRKKQMFKLQRKKRRGGILGFKELAAKAGLSPWHFHRVFRSVTGLTPKAYGDACWNTVTSSMPSMGVMPPQAVVNNTNTKNINSSTMASNPNMMQFYKAPSRSASSSAVNEMVNPYQHQYSVGAPNMANTNSFDPDGSVPMLDVGVPPMNYPFSSAGRVNTFDGPAGNDAAMYKNIPQQQQVPPGIQPFYQTVDFSNPQLDFSNMSEDKSGVSNTMAANDPLYTAGAIDALTSTSNLIPAVTRTTGGNAPHDDNSNRHAYNHWMPLPLFIDDPIGPIGGADLLFDDSIKAPFCIPTVGVLMTDNLDLEPPMSMMHLDSSTTPAMAPIERVHGEV